MLALDRFVPEYIRLFEPYYPSRPDPELMRLYKVDHLHRLNNNENALGPTEPVRRILDGLDPNIAPVYPNGDCYYLRCKLAERFGKTEEQFLVGNGSCEVISSIIRDLCEAGDNIITADRTFAVYEWVAEFSGLQARLVPLKDWGFDPDAMLDAVDGRTKILFVCNPNNPTGTYWDETTMRRFLDRLDGRAVVVMDEAYFEYVDKPDYPDGMRLMEEYPNIVVFRTFSKMYALAALRVGYLCADEALVKVIRRTHIAYSVNTLGQAAALVALDDDEPFILATRDMVARAKAQLSALFERMGVEYLCGEGNYMMARVPISDTLMYRKLMTHGVMVRTMTGFRFPGWIRISLVQRPAMDAFCRAFEAVLGG